MTSYLTTYRNELKMVGVLKLQMSQERAQVTRTKTDKLQAAREKCFPRHNLGKGLGPRIEKKTLESAGRGAACL